MVESEQDVALEDTDRIEGRSALVNNTNAAIALAGAVRSTLGPRGSDKMLVDENGEIIVTNDGVTVLETAKVEHPTANLLIATSSAQDRIARDGTTTSVLLTAELLRNALELSRIGVHPTIIMNGIFFNSAFLIFAPNFSLRKSKSTLISFSLIFLNTIFA